MASVARLQQYAALLELGLSKVFKDTLPTHPKLYGAWLAEKKAKEFTEDELLTSGFGTMPSKPIGGPFTTDKPKISDEKDYTLLTYGLGFVIEYEMMRWDKYQVFENITKKLTRSGVDRKNVDTYAILNNATDSGADAKYLTYSGEALCSTSHNLLRGGTAKNAPSAAVALSYLGVQEAITDFYLLPNEDGLFIVLSPSKLICHPSRKWIANTIVGSDYRPDNANMNKNTLKDADLSVHCSPYLTSTTRWFVTADKQTLKDHSMSFHIGDDLMFRRDNEQSTWNATFTMYGSWRVGVFHWYGMWGTDGV